MRAGPQALYERTIGISGVKMEYPQANQELTVGAWKEMTDHIEKQSRFPFHKKMSTIDGTLRYTRLALETYCNAKATIEPIDEGFWKFLITVDGVEEAKKEEELPPWASNETMDPVEQAQIELQCAARHGDAMGIAEATANLATAKMAKLLKGGTDETH